jgi:hypothetical protein
LVPKTGEDDDELDLDDHQALIEFSTTSYAVLEREQRVDLKIKRRGSKDIDIRFRCLITCSLIYSFVHVYAIMQRDAI